MAYYNPNSQIGPIYTDKQLEKWKVDFTNDENQLIEVKVKLDKLNEQYLILANNQTGIQQNLERAKEYLKTADKFFQQVQDEHFQDHCGGDFHNSIRKLTTFYEGSYDGTFGEMENRIRKTKKVLKDKMNVQGKKLNKLVDDMNSIYYASNHKVGYEQKRHPWEETYDE